MNFVSQTYFNPGFNKSETLTERLHALHQRLIISYPSIDRIACAVYDPKEDALNTFVNSTRSGEPIEHYGITLSQSASLKQLATNGGVRVIDDIPSVTNDTTLHGAWLLKQGYQSSLTVPMYSSGLFIGLIFFDSLVPAAFTPQVQRDLMLYCNLINMSLSSEFSAVKSIVATAHLARDFAQLRDFETGTHLERMARYSRIVAEKIAVTHGLTDEFIEHLFLFAPLHDIGKIGIPDEILLKPGKLSPDERAAMEQHVVKGVEIIKKIIGEFELEHMPDSQLMQNVVSYHHEFYDGSGYPYKLKGEAIPIEASIVTVADIFDALTSDRPYKAAWSDEDAILELECMADAGKLDPACVIALASSLSEISHVRTAYQDVQCVL